MPGEVNLNTARCLQLSIGIELNRIGLSNNLILDGVNELAKLAEGEVQMKYCRDCIINKTEKCERCYHEMDMRSFKRPKEEH